VNVESDEIHIVTMANAFGVTVKIANLDPAPAPKGINYHEISPMDPLNIANMPIVTLLYRPGHYDVLYLSELK
jgi:ubiquitin thioesterase protein OTUB1